MIDPTIPSESKISRVALAPNFFSALRAVWMFTWKSQLTLKKLPISLLSILGLPVLMILTTQSPESWALSHRPKMGSASGYMNGISKRLKPAGLSLEPELRAQIIAIAFEEYQATEKSWQTPDGREMDPAIMEASIQATHARIRDRVKPLLDEKVFAEFVEFQKPKFNQQPITLENGLWTRTSPFYRLLVDLYLFLVLPMSCVRTCGAVIRDELENDTLGFLTTRPIRRATQLVVKFLAHTTWLQIWMLLQVGLLFLVGYIRHIPDLQQLIPVFLGVQVLAVCSWCALGLFLGMVSKKYMPLALLYGGLIEMGIGSIPTNINTLSMMRQMKALLGHNVELENFFNWPDISTGVPVLVLILAVPLFVTLAAFLFTFREYHHANEVQR
ncbi:MAG: hypothetical protein JWN25_620 [Verrucomicrobiales bacterium]|nr:hypothetical protein [Verrucomicrobiales bacterium]